MNDGAIERGAASSPGGPAPAPQWAGAPSTPPGLPWPPPAARPARRTWPLLTAAAIATLLLGGGVGFGVAQLTSRDRAEANRPPAGATPADSTPTAAQARALYQQAVAAARAAVGCHYVAVSTGGGSQRIEGDAGRDGGRQIISTGASNGGERFTLLLVNGIVYFQGNAAAVIDQLGVSAAKAPGLAGGWISVSANDGPFGVLSPGISVVDQAQQIAMVPTSTARATAAGAQTRILGTIRTRAGADIGNGHLDIVAATHLPVEYASTVTAADVAATSTTTFSAWGVAPAVSAPSGATAWATLGASQPAGGYGGGASSGGSATPSPTP